MKFFIIADTDQKTTYEQFVKKDPLTTIVKLPPYVADVNDWLRKDGTQSKFEMFVKRSKSYIELKINSAALKMGTERDEAIHDVLELFASIDDKVAQSRIERLILSRFEFSKREFNALKKTVIEGEKKTESEIRDIWIERFPDTLYGLGEWRRYEDGYWPAIPDSMIEREIMDILEEFENSGGPACDDRHVRSVAALARRKLFTDTNIWDSRNNILVCLNGVFNLENMQVEEHSKEHYSTTRLNYDYDATAACPAFLTAVGTLSQEVQEFLQEYAGYCLTTDSKHEIAIWLYGLRGAGKSTILAGFESLLGEYCGYLSLAQIERSRFALANIPGKRLLISTESPDRYVKSTHILNALISGEAVEVERKNKDVITIHPLAKLMWAMNDLPKIGSVNDGIFRRVHIINFPIVPFSKRDETLKKRIAGESAGILNWAIAGLKRLEERGHFEPPFDVTLQNEMWEVSNDKAQLFVSEWCETHTQDADFMTNPAKRTSSEILYETYKEWCLARNYHHEGLHRMYNEWMRLKFKPVTVNSDAYWCGVTLRPVSERIEYGF